MFNISPLKNIERPQPGWNTVSFWKNRELRNNKNKKCSYDKKGDIMGKPAELLILEKKNIWETSKLQLKVLEMLITPGPTIAPLILKTRQLLTKALLEPEKLIRSVAYQSDT